MNMTKMTLISTVVAAAFGLAFGLMSTPAEAHCARKHTGDHAHCTAGGPIVRYEATLAGAFAFVDKVVFPNNRENVLRSEDFIDMVRPGDFGDLDDTWDQVFIIECPVLLGEPVDSFFVGPFDWSINMNDDESFVDVVLVVFQDARPELEGGLSDAEVNIQFRTDETDGQFLPAPGATIDFDLTRGGINGSSVRGVHPREACQLQGEGGSEIFELILGQESLTLSITAIVEP